MKQSEIHNKIRANVQNELNEILNNNYYFILNEGQQIIILEAGFLDKISGALKTTKEWVTDKIKNFVNSEIVQKFSKGLAQVANNIVQQYKDIVTVFQKVNPAKEPIKFLKALIVLIGKNPEKYNAEEIIIPKDQNASNTKTQGQVATQAESKEYNDNILFEFYDKIGYNFDLFFPVKNGKLIQESLSEGWESIVSLASHGFSALANTLSHMATKANNADFAAKIKEFEHKYNPEHALKKIPELAGDKGEEFVNTTLEEAQIPKVLNHSKKEILVKITEAIIFIGFLVISIIALTKAGPILFAIEATAMAITAPNTFKDLIKIFSSFEPTKPIGVALNSIKDNFLNFLGKAKKESANSDQNQNQNQGQNQNVNQEQSQTN